MAQGKYFEDATQAYNDIWKTSHPEGKGVIEVSSFLVDGGGVVVMPTEGQRYSNMRPSPALVGVPFFHIGRTHSAFVSLGWCSG